MYTLTNLPVEVLSLIIRFSNTLGDLSPLRLVCSTMNSVIREEVGRFLEDIRLHHGISTRVMQLYDHERNLESCEQVRYYLAFRRNVAKLEMLIPFVGGNMESGIVGGLLVFYAFSHSIRSRRLATSLLQTNNPSPEELATEWGFRARLTVSEIETLIHIINLCSSAIWVRVGTYRSPSARDFSCHQGINDTLQQAVLTEHVICNGPLWVYEMLCHQPPEQWSELFEVKTTDILNVGCYRESWYLSTGDAARYAASGLARSLWRERTIKIKQEADERRQDQVEHGSRPMAEVRVHAGIWRGGAGDL